MLPNTSLNTKCDSFKTYYLLSKRATVHHLPYCFYRYLLDKDIFFMANTNNIALIDPYNLYQIIYKTPTFTYT